MKIRKRRVKQLTFKQWHAKRKAVQNRLGWARWVRHRARHLKPGTIIETCGLDVARVVSVDPDSDDVTFESLMFYKDQPFHGSCSIYNCAPLRLSEYGIKKRLELFEKGGRDAVTKRYYVEDCKMSEEKATATLLEDKAAATLLKGER